MRFNLLLIASLFIINTNFLNDNEASASLLSIHHEFLTFRSGLESEFLKDISMSVVNCENERISCLNNIPNNDQRSIDEIDSYCLEERIKCMKINNDLIENALHVLDNKPNA